MTTKQTSESAAPDSQPGTAGMEIRPPTPSNCPPAPPRANKPKKSLVTPEIHARFEGAGAEYMGMRGEVPVQQSREIRNAGHLNVGVANPEQGMVIDMLQQEGIDKWDVALHEAGHCAVAAHFNVPWGAAIQRVGPASAEAAAYRGRSIFDPSTPFRLAAMAWGGIVMTHLRELPRKDWAEECWRDLQYESFFPWFDEECSPSDAHFIRGHPQSGRSLKLAWEVIMRNQNRLLDIATALEQNGTAGEERLWPQF